MLIRIHHQTLPMLQYSGMTLYKKDSQHFLYKITSISLQGFAGFHGNGVIGREVVSKYWAHFSFLGEKSFDSYCMANQSKTKVFRCSVYVPSVKDSKACIATLLQIRPNCTWCSAAHTIRRKIYEEETCYIHFPGKRCFIALK